MPRTSPGRTLTALALVGATAAVAVLGARWVADELSAPECVFSAAGHEVTLTPEQAATLVRAIMNDRQTKEFDSTKECNFAIAPPGIGRFRVSAFMQQGQVGCVIRTINATIPSFEELDLPDVLKEVVMSKRVLVLLVGGTLVGKAMDDAPVTCTLDTDLDEVRRIMLERHARYMPVMDQRMLMGVISFYDVAKAVVDSQNFENKMLKAYIRDWPADEEESK